MSYRSLLSAMCERFDEWHEAVTTMPLLRDPVTVLGCLDTEGTGLADGFVELFSERFNLGVADGQDIERLLQQGQLESQAKSAELGRRFWGTVRSNAHA